MFPAADWMMETTPLKHPAGSTFLKSAMTDSEVNLLEALVASNRILANEGIFDAYGHISVRSEQQPQEFLLSCSRSPRMVGASDIVRYRLDGTEVTPDAGRPYVEKVIHAAIYEARSDVQAVCHAHSEGVLPFSASGERIRPVLHSACLFWKGVEWFDDYDEGGNLLISSASEGRALAEALGDRRGIVLRNHGFVVVGEQLVSAVMAAVYLDQNARVQLAAQQLGNVLFIDPDEAQRGGQVFLSGGVQARAWNHWLARLPQGWQQDAGVSAEAGHAFASTQT